MKPEDAPPPPRPPPRGRTTLLFLLGLGIAFLAFQDADFLFEGSDMGGGGGGSGGGGRLPRVRDVSSVPVRSPCPPAPGLSNPHEFAASDTRFFDQAVVAQTMGLFGRFAPLQRPHLAWRGDKDRRHTFPIITGDSFRMLADVWADNQGDLSGMMVTARRDDTPLMERLTPEQALIVFLGNDDNAIWSLLTHSLFEALPRPLVIVTINGDNKGINPSEKILEHPKIRAVFSQNCLGQTAKVRCLPIGLENRQWSMHGWTPETIMGSMLGAQTAPSPLEHVERARALREGGTGVATAFACFGVHTNPGLRGPLDAQLNAGHLDWIDRNCNNGLVNFHRNMLQRAAVIAPEGNGMDTLRAWEALYLGRALVGVHSAMDPLWEDLPYVFLNSWADLSREAVEEGVRNISTPARLARSRAATKRLFMPYWACEVGKAALRESEFCGEEALAKAYAREEFN